MSDNIKTFIEFIKEGLKSDSMQVLQDVNLDEFNNDGFGIQIFNVIQNLPLKEAEFLFDLAVKNDAVTILSLLLKDLDPEIKRVLLDEEREDLEGDAPLLFAAYKGYVDIVKILLQAGAEVDTRAEDGSTALHAAARGGNVALLSPLLEAGLALDDKDYDESTPLHIASREGHTAFVQALLQAGAKKHAKTKLLGFTPLHEAVEKGHVATVKMLLNAGVRINARNRFKNTSLHNAAYNQDAEMVRLLLQAGANKDIKNYNEETALDRATERRKFHQPRNAADIPSEIEKLLSQE